jgi:hypothetical protein
MEDPNFGKVSEQAFILNPLAPPTKCSILDGLQNKTMDAKEFWFNGQKYPHDIVVQNGPELVVYVRSHNEERTK